MSQPPRPLQIQIYLEKWLVELPSELVVVFPLHAPAFQRSVLSPGISPLRNISGRNGMLESVEALENGEPVYPEHIELLLYSSELFLK